MQKLWDTQKRQNNLIIGIDKREEPLANYIQQDLRRQAPQFKKCYPQRYKKQTEHQVSKTEKEFPHGISYLKL